MSIRCQYTAKQKQRVVLYARNHGVRPAERKFSIPRKNIQRWLKNFRDDGFEQSFTSAYATVLFRSNYMRWRCSNRSALWPLRSFIRSNKKRLSVVELFLRGAYIRIYTVVIVESTNACI